jgi:ABC-2 type transport system permease protein
MATLALVTAMFKRYAIEMKRYYFNTLSMLASFYLIFVLVFFGARSFAGNEANFGGTLAGIVVGFGIFYLSMYAYAELSWVLTGEAQQGTLEQLSMSPLGLGRVLVARLASAMVFRLVIMVGFLLLMMATSGRWLRLDVVTLVPLFAFTVASVLGIGFIMGGLAIVFKQIQAALGILQFAFVALIAAPVDQFPFLKFLPLSWGTSLIGRSMIGGVSIFAMPLSDVTFLVANGLFYFSLGLLIFKFFEREARNRGLLGHY